MYILFWTAADLIGWGLIVAGGLIFVIQDDRERDRRAVKLATTGAAFLFLRAVLFFLLRGLSLFE